MRQEAESWILGINKYFQVQDFAGNMKARVDRYYDDKVKEFHEMILG